LLKTAIVVSLVLAGSAAAQARGHRPEGPCDIYARAGDPCVAAHSTTRALSSTYNGPLYRLLRQSDGRSLDIGSVRPTARDRGGYADAAAQDRFCADTRCWITTIYDQSGNHNDLTQPPRGGFSGPAMGGFDNIPLADMAPVSVMGHKVYGVLIEPGMGLRNDRPRGTAVDDQAEGQYWVINGRHFNSGCCFDYGNAEIDSRDDGNGTMEALYFGNADAWYHGTGPGPWLMTDQENNLVGCVNPEGDTFKLCSQLPTVNWRFVTAMAKGEAHHWTSLGGDAQQGRLALLFDGPRVDASYDPMRKQGAILLGNGGDNSDSSQGTFYEGAMTAAGTFPTNATDQLVQANIVAAGYAVAPPVSPGMAAAHIHSTVKINEFSASATQPFIELYNAGGSAVDLSNWTLTEHASRQAIFSSIHIPAGTKMPARGFYLLGLSNSGLAVDARAGDATIYVRSITGMKAGDEITIGDGAGAEHRTIASLGTAAGEPTTIWQPLPDGPVMTLAAGATNVPVTSVAGMEPGEKIALGYGASYPVVAQAREHYEVVTLTAVGKPGTQTRLKAAAAAGSSTLAVNSGSNISPGDGIRLDIDSSGHGIEPVTVAQTGAELTLEAPLRFNHSANLPFSDRGTGVSFEPAAKFSHSSNEPVMALGTGIVLDAPLTRGHAIDAMVRDASNRQAGYQGTPEPNQWVGGPALSPAAGAIVLRDASGLMVDSVNYGLLVDPWAAQGGCAAPALQVADATNRSAGRFPDGTDSHSNCDDFHAQAVARVAAASAVGAENVKVSDVSGFQAGQRIFIDNEPTVIAAVGTPGATTIAADTAAGAGVIPIAASFRFRAGQAIVIGAGKSEEKATVAAVSRGRAPTVTVSSPLQFAHTAGEPLTGTGLTLTAALAYAHTLGAPVASQLATPGAPNQSN
jgi:hypothetical protein